MVCKTEYVGEFVQSIIVGSILAVAIFAILIFGNVNIGQDPNVVIIIVMFLVGTFAVWWALHRMKGKDFLGFGEIF